MTVFIVGFLVSVPLVLFYTAGYRYDIKKHQVEKTGILVTDSSPTGAHIVLNDVPQKVATPTSFTRILPEDYRIRFEKQGYFSWEKTVEVRSSETTFVTDALLLSNSLPRLVLDGKTSMAVFSPDGRHEALIHEDNAWKELSVLDAGKSAPVLLARYSSTMYTDATLQWSPDNTHLLLSAHGKDGKPVLLLYSASDTTQTPRALQSSFPGAHLDAAWSNDGSQIVVNAVGGVFLMNTVDGKVIATGVGGNIQDAALRDNTLFVLRPSKNGTALERHTPGDLSAVKPLTIFPAGRYHFLDAAGPYLLILDAAKQKLFVVSPNDGTLVDTLPATHAAWLAKSKTPRLLAWNDFEITAVDILAGTHVLVARLGTPITGCTWHPSGLAVFYATTNSIIATDLDDRDTRNVVTLVKFTELGGFALDATDGVLRFVGAVGNARGLYEKEY